MVRVYIDYTHEYADDILQFACNQSKVNHFDLPKNKVNHFDLMDITSTEEGEEDVKLMVFYGQYHFKFEEDFFLINYYTEGDIVSCSHGPDRKRCIYIECAQTSSDVENIKSIKKLLVHIKKSSKPELENSIRIFLSTNNKWEKLNVIQKRPLNTVFINKKDTILADIDKFMMSESIYRERGIKYKRNYLLYGPPGTGKTSFITSIASKYNLDIFMVNFGGGITDGNFIKIISKLPEKSMLVLEDIDCLFSHSRESKTNVSFSTILNTLDGFACKNRLITFMTTNHKDRLDHALVRPGRIDFIFELSYAKQSQMKEMFSSYFPESNDFEELYNSIKNKQISTAAFHKFLFDNRDNSNILDPKSIELLENLTEQYKSYQNMYA